MHVEDLRILLVCNDGNNGGVANVIRQLLMMKGCVFRILCGSEGPFFDELVQSGQDARVLDLGSSFRSIKPFFSLAAEIRDFRPHLVHSHHARAYLRGRVAARLTGVPHISTPHTSLLDELDRRSNLPAWRKKMILLREKLTASFDTATIALTGYQRNMFNRLGVNDDVIRVIPNGVDLGCFPLSSNALSERPKARYTLGVVGRVTKEKGIGDLLAAFVELPSEIGKIPVGLLIIGEGKDRQYFEAMAANLGVSSRVTWLGHRTDIADLWQTIDVAVFPSRYEGLPLSLIEAMAARRPIVAVDLPVFKSVLEGECGKVVRHDQLAEGILDLLHSPEKAQMFAQNARIKAEKEFDLKMVLEKTYNLYRAVAVSVVNMKKGME